VQLEYADVLHSSFQPGQEVNSQMKSSMQEPKSQKFAVLGFSI